MEQGKKKALLIVIIIILFLVLAGLVVYFVFLKKDIKGYHCNSFTCYEGRKEGHENLSSLGHSKNKTVITDGNKIIFYNADTKEVEDTLYECKTDECEWIYMYVCDTNDCDKLNHTRMIVYDNEMVYYDHITKEKKVLPLKYDEVVSTCGDKKCGIVQPVYENVFLYSKELGPEVKNYYYLINGYKFDQYKYSFIMIQDHYAVLTRENGVRDIIDIETGKVVQICEDPDYCKFDYPDGESSFTLSTVLE